MRVRLLCPVCGALLGEATYQRWPGDLRIVDDLGRLTQPSSVGLLLQVAQQQLERAPDAATREAAPERRDFLRRHLGELVFDLACARGHRMLATMPGLVSAIRSAKGDWIAVPGE